MKIKLSSIYASPRMTAQPGSIIDVSDEEGQQLIAGRFGVVVETAALAPVSPEAPARETAAVAAPETAARPAARGSRSRSSAGASASSDTPAE